MPAGFSPEHVGTFALMIAIMVGIAVVAAVWGRLDTYRGRDRDQYW